MVATPVSKVSGVRRVEVSEKPTNHVGSAGSPDCFPVQPWEQVDRGVTAPGWDHGSDARIHQHRGELLGSLLGRSADDPGPVHAVTDDDVVPAFTQAINREIEASADGLAYPARRCGDADPVSRLER